MCSKARMQLIGCQLWIMCNHTMVFTFIDPGAALKGTYYAKNHFYKGVWTQLCGRSVCENNQPVMEKIHPLIFL